MSIPNNGCYRQVRGRLGSGAVRIRLPRAGLRSGSSRTASPSPSSRPGAGQAVAGSGGCLESGHRTSHPVRSVVRSRAWVLRVDCGSVGAFEGCGCKRAFGSAGEFESVARIRPGFRSSTLGVDPEPNHTLQRTATPPLSFAVCAGHGALLRRCKSYGQVFAEPKARRRARASP